MEKTPMYHTNRVLRNGVTHTSVLPGLPALLLMLFCFCPALAHQNETISDTLFVVDFHMADDVVEREPVELVDSYVMSDGRAWCFARIHNADRMQDLYFKWYYEGELYFKMNTKVGVSTNWRTYSSVGLLPGEWEVVLVDAEEQELARTAFLVSE
jgi:hypothetical protein